MKKIVLTSVVLLSLLTSVGCSKNKDEARAAEPVTTEQTTQDNKKLYKEAGLLTFKNEKQLELGELDSKSRATYAHIQLKDSDEPKDKREAKLKFDPVGWHNYKFYFGDGTKEAWLMNRGHLVGYQFSGLNDEGRNLVPMTAWLNTGAFTGTDDKNQSSMLYYENGLDSWLANHPNYYLDYKVAGYYASDIRNMTLTKFSEVGVKGKVKGKNVRMLIGDVKDAYSFYRARVVEIYNSYPKDVELVNGVPVEQWLVEGLDKNGNKVVFRNFSTYGGGNIPTIDVYSTTRRFRGEIKFKE